MDLQSMSTEALEAERAIVNAKRDELRERAVLYTAELNRRATVESAAKKLASMTEAERAAILAELQAGAGKVVEIAVDVPQ